MHHLRHAVLGIFAAFALASGAACGAWPGGDVASSAPLGVAPAHSASGPVTPATPAVMIPTCGPVQVPAFDAAAFPDPTKIDSRWFPLVPGTQFVFEAYANRNGAPLGRQIVVTVTNLTKVINGVPTVVVWEVDRNQSAVARSELAFYAQDRDGNVWTLGQYPELYARGRLTGAPKAWFAGLSRASAGLVVRGEPTPGSAEFLQVVAPNADLLDCAKDVRVDERTCVANTCYDGVAVIDERSGTDPASRILRRFHAPGVGSVRVEAVGDPAGETLLLASVVALDPTAQATARKNALDLEKRAYQSNATGGYRQTPPATLRQ